MTVWRYTAISLVDDSSPACTGEVPAADAAQVRASLRRIGLQVIDIRPLSRSPREGSRAGLAVFRSHQRSRRRGVKSELFDSLATMLDAGIPLTDAVQSLASSASEPQSWRHRSRRLMLVDLRESLRGGASLAQALSRHPAWFDEAELAMVRAGEMRGELARVLQGLAEKHHRSGELGARLAQALAYPSVVAVVGLGVVVFLSTSTLPKIVRILSDAKVPTPGLTVAVMSFGQFLAQGWPWMLLILAAAVAFIAGTQASLERSRRGVPRWVDRLVPSVVRRVVLARFSLGLADLVQTGVPLVDSIRAAAAVASGIASAGLRRQMLDAADRIERGESLSSCLTDPRCFDDEFRRVVQTAEETGDLAPMLRKIGERTERQARRLIDRTASLIEPAVILALAALIGVVVIAAVLPMIRLQEVIR